jgi:D-alanyl-D-alanine carboxypeptidase (penicillin-binding protein 5/6)
MRRTHYADSSGLDPHSRSDARDLAVLAARDMSIPVFASVVDESWAPIPVAGRIWNINPLLGRDGVIGVKSGFTQAAQGCLVAAARRQVGGRTVLVIALSLDQPGGVPGAGSTDRALLNAATARLAAYTVLPASARVAAVRARWQRSDLGVVGPASPTVVVGWPGLVVRVRETPVRLPPTAAIPPRSNESDTTRVDRVVFGITHYRVVETVTLTTDGLLGGVQAMLAGRADASLLAPPDSWLSG